MKKISYFAVLLFIIISLFIGGSCERFWVSIGYVVVNNTKSDLVGTGWGKYMADSTLCDTNFYLDYYLQPGLSENLAIRPGKGTLSDLPDSSKQYFYFFNLDSLNKYQKLQMCNGIVKRCLIKKIEIQLNKVKDQIDTIYIKSSKTSD